MSTCVRGTTGHDVFLGTDSRHLGVCRQQRPSVNGESVRGVFLHPLAQRLFRPNDRLSDIPERIVQINVINSMRFF